MYKITLTYNLIYKIDEFDKIPKNHHLSGKPSNGLWVRAMGVLTANRSGRHTWEKT
jgi:hypothetical protein